MNTTKSQKQLTCQRLRVKPMKKWTGHEEKLLIEFLLENRNGLESPTAQLFYKRFCYEKKLNIEWPHVRSKVRNMRMRYMKARAALETASAEEDHEDILKKCNYYKELDVLFAHRFTEPTPSSVAFENTMSSEDYSFQLDNDDTTTAPSEKSDKQDVLPTSSTKCGILKISPPSSNHQQSDLIQIDSLCSFKEGFVLENQQHDEDEHLNLRQRELNMKEKELYLEERRLSLKEKKIISEENIKVHKINSRERLKILEMEMKERLALEELKLKYK